MGWTPHLSQGRALRMKECQRLYEFTSTLMPNQSVLLRGRRQKLGPQGEGVKLGLGLRTKGNGKMFYICSYFSLSYSVINW